MSQHWFDAIADRPFQSPGWIGNHLAGIEASNTGGRCLLIDSRAADGTLFGPVITEAAQDFGAHILYRDIRPASAAWQIGGIGVVLRYVDADNYIAVDVGSAASANTGNVRERLVGNSYDTQVPALFASTPGGWRHLRVKLQGGVVRVRGWDDGSAEPSTWTIEHTLTGLIFTPGVARVSLPFAAGGALELAHIAIGTGADAPPSGPTKSISGVVEDEQGAPVGGRIIRVYARDTGALVSESVSDALTGTFTSPVERLGGYTALCVDDEAGRVENDYAVRTLL